MPLPPPFVRLTPLLTQLFAVVLGLLLFVRASVAAQPPADADDSWYTGYQGLQVLMEEQGLRPARDAEQALQDPSGSAVLLLGSLQNVPRSDWLRLRRFVAQGGALLAAFEETSFVRIPGVTTWFPGPIQSSDSRLRYADFEDVLELPTESEQPLVRGVPSLVINRSGWFAEPDDGSLEWSVAVRSPQQSQPPGSSGGVVLAVGTDPFGSGGLFILAADKSLFSDGMIWHGNNSILAINTSQLLADGRRRFLILETGRISSTQAPESPADDLPQMPPQGIPPGMMPPQMRPPQMPPPEMIPPRLTTPPPPSDLNTILRTANALLDKLQQSNLLNRTLQDRPRTVRPGGWLRTMLLLLLTVAGLWLLVLVCKRALPALPELQSRLMQSVYGVQTARQVKEEEFGAAAEVLCRRFCVEVTGSPLETDWLRLRGGRQLPPTLNALPSHLAKGLDEIVQIAIHGCRVSLPEWRFQQLGTQLRDLMSLHRRVA
jgi:hypothetical protein